MRRLLLVVAVASLAAGLVPRVAHAEDPIVVGRTSGVIDCRRYQYEKPDGSKGTTAAMPCDRRWDVDVVNDTSWSFDQARAFEGRAGNGISYSSTIRTTATFTSTLDEQGRLTEFVLAADLEATVTHAGDTTQQLKLDIPFTAAADQLRLSDTLIATAEGEDNYVSRVEISAELDCEGDGSEPTTGGNRVLEQTGRDVRTIHQGSPNANLDLSTGNGTCVLHVLANVDARNSSVVKSDHAAHARAQLEVHLEESPCDLSGTVFDGDQAVDGHANPMSGIRVTAYDEETEISDAVSGADGRYCLRDVAPGDYELRASLVYETYDPWIFRTLYAKSPLPENTTRSIVEEDAGRDDLDLAFDSTDERPNRADAANIHWQSTRFVDWLIESGVATVAELDRFTITALSGDPSSNYNGQTKDVHLKDVATPFSARDAPDDLCPENCEWHEIAHHVGGQLGIASYLSPNCTGRVAAHGGWRNGSTCDSMAEGFATFLAALGSLTIDADRGPGYATPEYSVFGSLEDDGHRPWTLFTSRGTVYGREDFAVSELLWDLVDATPEESGVLALTSSRGTIRTPDAISIDGPALVRAMADRDVMTVVDVYTMLSGSDLVPQAQKRPSIDIDGSPSRDVSALAALFLVHDFHPVGDITVPWYTPGDPVAVTNRQPVDSTTGRPVGSAPPTGATSRRDTVIETPGAAIAFANSTPAPVTYEIDIKYPQTTGHRSITVAPGERVVAQVELPPYWRTFVEPGVLPPCDADLDHVVTMTISGGGVDPRTISNCEYWQLIAAATDGVALTFGDAAPVATVGPGEPGPAAAGDVGSTLLLVVGAGLVVVLVAIVAFVARRRGGAPRQS